MQSVCVCRFCGRTIDSSFVFCPWCGGESSGRTFENTQVFRRLEDLQEKGMSLRISKMEQSLNEIERDLIRFMEAPEKR